MAIIPSEYPIIGSEICVSNTNRALNTLWRYFRNRALFLYTVLFQQACIPLGDNTFNNKINYFLSLVHVTLVYTNIPWGGLLQTP